MLLTAKTYAKRFTKEAKIPKIGSADYKALPFKEQLQIYSMYISDKNKYVELTGGIPSDDDLAYVNEAVSFIASQTNTGMPQPRDTPIGFVQDYWACYHSYYNPAWYEDGLSPLDMLGIKHRRVFNMQLFTFPLLACDFVTHAILAWLVERRTKYLADLLYYVVRMRAAAEYFFEYNDLRMLAVEDDVKKTNPLMIEIWNEAVKEVNLATIEEINGTFPIVEECDMMSQVEDATYVMCYPQAKYVDKKRSFIPLVPAELYTKSQFKIRGWDFLESMNEVPSR